MSPINIGRTDYVGLAIEATQGSAESTPAVYLPFTDCSLDDKHERLSITSGKSRREEDIDSKLGKLWCEGDLEINLDVVNAGYLLKLAMGNEVLTAGTPNNHEFYTTTSGNAPKTATIWVARSATDVRRFVGCAVDNMELGVEGEGIGTLKVGLIGESGSEVAALTPTTTSGTIFSFANYNAKFGATVAAAGGASATKLNSFQLNVNNNIKALWQSNSNNPSTIRTAQFKVAGNYVRFYEDVVDRNKHLANQANAAIFTFTGNTNEELRIRLSKIFLDTLDKPFDLDDFYVQTADFTATLDDSQLPNQIDFRLQNNKGTVY